MRNIEPDEEKYLENIIFCLKTEDIRQNTEVKYLPAIYAVLRLNQPVEITMWQ